MAYATFDDVISRYRPIQTMIGTGTNDVTTVDVTSIYVAGAEGIVNAYLGAKYAVPLQTEPIITKITADIAIHDMLADRASRVPEIAGVRYTNATSLLGMLRDGEMVLTSSQTLITSGDQEAYSSTSSYHPTFSPVLDPLDQQVDDAWVDADKTERNLSTNSWC